MLDVTDSFSRDKPKELISAQSEAEALRAYWRSRGHDIRVWVELDQAPIKGCLRDIYVIRSDLVNGQPRGEAPA